MLDIDLEEALVEKVGGKFALTSLLQKRMVELNRGALPLIQCDTEDESKDLRRLACREILEGKIVLGPRDEIQHVVEEEPSFPDTPPEKSEAPVEGEESQEVYGSDIKKIKEQRIRELAQLLNPKK